METETLDYSELSMSMIICNTLDLNSITLKYDGYTKYKRLQFIVNQCQNLRQEALTLLIKELKKGCNADLYLQTFNAYSKDILDANIELDKEWTDHTLRQNSSKLEKLINESNVARNSMLTESIRISYGDLGYYYYDIGNLNEAQRQFLKMRDFCSTAKHASDMAFNVVTILLDLNQMTMIPSFLTKSNSWDSISLTKVKAVIGLLALCDSNYYFAANNFLTVENQIESDFSTIMATEDIALYGVLCGMASIDRLELKKLIDNKTFKMYLELTPNIEILISNFLSRKYGDCVLFLDHMMSEWKLDLYLSHHIENIISNIKKRIIINYFKPYTAVNLVKMSLAINIEFNQLDSILAKLIIENSLDAKINDETNTLVRRQVNVKSETLSNVLNLSRSHVDCLKDGLVRLSIIKNNLQVTLNSDNSDDVYRKSENLSLNKSHHFGTGNFVTRSQSSKVSISSSLMAYSNDEIIENRLESANVVPSTNEDNVVVASIEGENNRMDEAD